MIIFRHINGRNVPLDVQHEEIRLQRKAPAILEYDRWLKDEYFLTQFSFVNPNALCPVCGDMVFYYEHSNGSKVYFDELGPPWPKHPCTDNFTPYQQEPNLLDDGYFDNEVKHNPPNWYVNGWRPVVLINTTYRRDCISPDYEGTCYSDGYLFSFRLSTMAMRKLGVGIRSLSCALMLLYNKQPPKLSIHTGKSEKTILDVSRIEKISFNNQEKISNLQIILSDKDGDNTIISGKINNRDFSFIINPSNPAHRRFEGHLIKKKPKTINILKLNHSSKEYLAFTSKSCLLIEKTPYKEIKKLTKSPQQKAQLISNEKEKTGNSTMADAFYLAFSEK